MQIKLVRFCTKPHFESESFWKSEMAQSITSNFVGQEPRGYGLLLRVISWPAKIAISPGSSPRNVLSSEEREERRLFSQASC